MRPDWLNDMPSSWTNVPFGSIFTQSKRKNSRLQRNFVLSVMKDRGVIPYTEKGNVGNKVSDDLSGYKLVDKGDFVLNSMNLYMGSVGVSEYDGVTSTAYMVCKPSENIYAGYYNYLIQFKGFQEYVGFLGKGIMEIREAVRWTALKSVFVPLPDLPTQRAIADFLDRETARLDSLIEKKQRLVKLLGEKRSAVITAAVTGNHSNTSEKSGGRDCRSVEGGGEVIIYRLKHFLERNDGGCWGDDPTGIDDAVVLRSTEQTADGKWRIDNPAFRHISTSERKNKSIERDDIIITKSSGSTDHIGKASIADSTVVELEAVYSNFMQRIRVNRHASPKYVWHLLNSSFARYHYNVFATSTSGLGNLNGGIVSNLPFPLPDLPTQRAIADFLDCETARLDEVIERTRLSIDRLKEYRSALITSAVTGQIDVQTYAKSGTTDRQLDAIQTEMPA